MLERFDRVKLEATYSEKRDANAMTGKEPLLFEGAGSVVYRSDGEHWFLKNDGYSFRSGEAHTHPSVTITGYDGVIHYTGDARQLTFGEEGFRKVGRPRDLIWNPAISYNYMLKSLEREEAKITFDGADQEGRRIVEVVSPWGSESNRIELTVRFDVQRSFLPLVQELKRNGKAYSKVTIDEITPVAGTKQWYPALIRTEFLQATFGLLEQTYAITKFELPDQFADAAFRFEPRAGIDVIDRRTNLAWHNDPWWDELTPWLVGNVSWPRFQFQSLGEFKSYVKASTDGMVAPPISADHWIGESPGGWDRPDRTLSVLYFYGDASRLISPHPKWLTELGQLHELLQLIGGEVIMIASDSELEPTKRALSELQATLPVALDTHGQDSRFGTTHDAFGLQHELSVLLVDGDQKVRVISDKKDLVKVLEEHLDQEAFAEVQRVLAIHAFLSPTDQSRIRNHWRELRRKTRATGSISGQCDPTQNAEVTLVPHLRLLAGANVGGYFLLQDPAAKQSVEPNQFTGAFEFADLPRGYYKVQMKTRQGKEVNKTLLLPADDSQVVVFGRLDQR
ncbi:MAG: peroxiredoxin family protein [Rubripirellula sp.]